MQLRFASLVVINSRWDFHPQECAHAGRTKEKPAGVNRRAWRDKNLQPRIEPILCVRMWLLQALRMSPFDIAVFIVPISLTIAICVDRPA
jgi:hypothetical protein